MEIRVNCVTSKHIEFIIFKLTNMSLNYKHFAVRLNKLINGHKQVPTTPLNSIQPQSLFTVKGQGGTGIRHSEEIYQTLKTTRTIFSQIDVLRKIFTLCREVNKKLKIIFFQWKWGYIKSIVVGLSQIFKGTFQMEHVRKKNPYRTYFFARRDREGRGYISKINYHKSVFFCNISSGNIGIRNFSVV